MTYILCFLAITIFGLYSCGGFGKRGFEVEGKKVMYYTSNKYGKKSSEEVKGVDIKTFEVLKSKGNQFAKDKNYFYIEGEIHPKLDHASAKYLGSGFFKDKNQVIHYRTVLKGANPKEYRLLKNGYGMDNKTVFFVTRAIPNSDPKTFKVIDENFARDKNTLYMDWQVVEGANPVGFKYLNDNRAYIFHTDGQHVYNRLKKLNGADLKSWKYIGYNYSKDKNHVYYLSNKVIGADPKSFEESRGKGYDAMDAQHKYKTGKRVKD